MGLNKVSAICLRLCKRACEINLNFSFRCESKKVHESSVTSSVCNLRHFYLLQKQKCALPPNLFQNCFLQNVVSAIAVLYVNPWKIAWKIFSIRNLTCKRMKMWITYWMVLQTRKNLTFSFKTRPGQWFNTHTHTQFNCMDFICVSQWVL